MQGPWIKNESKYVTEGEFTFCLSCTMCDFRSRNFRVLF